MTPITLTYACEMVLDSGGYAFDPDSCSHVYGYTNALLTTDTATDPLTGIVRVKTYTYSGTALTNESQWVQQ